MLATFGIILFLNQGVKFVWGAAPLNAAVPEWLSGSVELPPGCSIRCGGSSSSARARRRAAALCAGEPHPRRHAGARRRDRTPPMVSALGVNIRRLFMIVFGFGTMLAGFAGIMVAPILSVEPGMGDTILILAFVVIVIGGIGSIRGAFLAALMIGLVDTLGRSFAADIAAAVHGDPRQRAPIGPALASMLIYLLHGAGAVSSARPAFSRRKALRMAHVATPHPHAARRSLFAGDVAAGPRSSSLFALVPLASPRLGAEAYVLSPRHARDDLRASRRSRSICCSATARWCRFGHAAFLGLGAYAVGILRRHGIGGCADLAPRGARRLGAVRARRPARLACAPRASISS